MEVETKLVTLQVKDGEIEVREDILKASKLIKEMLEVDDGESLGSIPLPNVDEATMKRVVAFLEYHHNHPMPAITKPVKSAELKDNIPDGEWYVAFIDAIQVTNHKDLFDLVLAANYLDLESLLDLGCAKIATLLKNRTPKEIREFFGITEPTPDEEEQIRKQNQWIFDVTPVAPAAGAADGAGAAADVGA